MLTYWHRIEKIVEKLNADLGLAMKRSYALTVDLPASNSTLAALYARVRDYVCSDKTEKEFLDRSEVLQLLGPDLASSVCEFPFVYEQMIAQHAKVRIKASEGAAGIILMSGIKPTAALPGSTLMAGNVQATCDYAVRRALDDKLPRLRGVRGFDCLCLLLVICYPLISRTELLESLGQCQGDLSALRAIHAIWGDSTVELIHG